MEKKILDTIFSAIRLIDEKVRTAEIGKAGSVNLYGEEQLKLDVLSDKIVQDECKKNPLIGLIASEEIESEVVIGDGECAVAYDPLDGSSLVDVNLAIGSIFGVYKGKKSFIGAKGDDQIAAVAALYGPRTIVLVAVKDEDGVKEFTLKNGEFVLTREDIKIGEGKMFAPGNLRACGENKKYLKLVEYWMNEEYTLRYSGGMVPDIFQILLKGKGIFSYPAYSKYPSGKLRILFECAPFSMLAEKAGGASSDGKGRVMEKAITEVSQRTPIFIGSNEEVARCVKYLV